VIAHLAVSLVLNPVVAADTAPKPNIIYLLVDDLGYADCGFNGGTDIQTPNIDRLAHRGAILKSFYVQPLCSPTRATLMTGRYPTHTGVYSIVSPGATSGLPLTERTLPQALREVGYATAITGKWHLGEYKMEFLPLQRGFDHQYGHMFGMIDYFKHSRDGQLDWYRDDQPLNEEGYSTNLIAKEACRMIRERAKDKPLFLYVPFNGIHSPYQVPESYEEPYKNLAKSRKTIAGMLSAVDEAIGQIVATLEEQGLSNDTLIMYSSDNGGPGPGVVTMNTPLRAGKGTIYEGGVRVCAFATWPGKIPEKSVITEPIHMVDWYPTLLTLTGAPTAQSLAVDGLNIWPVITKRAKSPHDAILLMGTKPGHAAIRMGDWKLLLNPSDKYAENAVDDNSKSERLELYNLADDISEKNNIAATQPERVKELRARLELFFTGAAKPRQKEKNNVR